MRIVVRFIARLIRALFGPTPTHPDGVERFEEFFGP